MQQVQVISPEGELGTVDFKDLHDAVLQEGYRIAEPADIAEHEKKVQYGEGLANVAKAGLAGAARGASFGISDKLLPKLPFGPSKETLSALQKYNPVSSGVGEGAGVLGSLALLPGGGLAGAVGKAGGLAGDLAASKTASSLLGSLGKAAVGNTVQGAFYGAGHVLSEDALGDPALNAQKAWSQIGTSALLSGALGGVLKLGEIAAPKIAETVGSVAGKAFNKASSLVSGIPEEEIAAMAANRGAGTAAKGLSSTGGILSEAAASAAPSTAESFAEKLLEKMSGGHSSGGDKVVGYGALGMAAHALGVPGKVIGGTIGTYEALKNPALTMSRLANLENLLQKATSAVTKNANAIFEGGLSGVGSSSGALLSSKLSGSTESKEELTEQYQKAVSKVQDVSAHPEKFIQAMNDATEALYPHAPQITGQLHQTAGTAMQFLQDKIPKPTSIISPLSPEFVPSQAEMGKFMHYYDIVADPIKSLQELRMGVLSPDTIETLNQVHPKLYDDMKQNVFDKMVEKKDSIPYQRKAMLSMFLQEPLDESLVPSSMLMTQKVYQTPQGKTQMGSVPGVQSHGLGGVSKLNMASRAKTGSQKSYLGAKL